MNTLELGKQTYIHEYVNKKKFWSGVVVSANEYKPDERLTHLKASDIEPITVHLSWNAVDVCTGRTATY